MIIEKFYRDYPPIKNQIVQPNLYASSVRDVLIEMPVLPFQMLPSPDLRKFYRSILDKLRTVGGSENVLFRPHPYEEEIIGVLKHYKVKVLVIDELHNLLGGRSDKQREFLNALRYLGNALKISIVGVGTKEAYLAIRSDPQLENRFEPFLLSAWQKGQDYESLLASIIRVLPLKYAFPLNHPALSNIILEKTEGILGEIMTFIRRAAILAIQTGTEIIDEEVLKKVDYYSPTERVRLFERSIV